MTTTSGRLTVLPEPRAVQGWTSFAAIATGCLLGLPAPAQDAPPADCADTAAALAYWRPVHENASASAQPADALALSLVACLGAPDPALRDSIAYELFTYWLRQEKLTDATRQHLSEALTARLRDNRRDAVLSRSFSALVLAELMRSDAHTPFMSATQRQHLLAEAVGALQKETDYRGLDVRLGWVHPVAHTADLLWRFALHPGTTPIQAVLLLEGIGSQIAPPGVFYTFNEGDRLARVAATLIRRELVDGAAVAAWLSRFESPQRMPSWSDAFRSPAGMAELHDTKQFLRALSDQLHGVGVAPEIAAQLASLVEGFTHLI